MIAKNLNILNNFNILYLEDDKSLLIHTKDILDDFFKNVFAVQNCKDAMTIIENEKIDVIISDILLENENGIDFLRLLKSNDILIPSILTTAHTDTKYLLDAIKLKVENYIIKPINIKELLDSLYDILLPIIQDKEIKKSSNIIKTISAITNSKQVEVIKYIISNLDEKNELLSSYSEIMSNIPISKPTLIKLFRQLASQKILLKISHKKYKFNEKVLNIV